jgi:hypothetical protein
MDLKGKKNGILILCVALVGIIWIGSALTTTMTSDEPQVNTVTAFVTSSNDPNSNIDNDVDNEVNRLIVLLHRYANDLGHK